jgi:GNAT superfamily N-acetyltransferase
VSKQAISLVSYNKGEKQNGLRILMEEIMPTVDVRRADYQDIETMRELYGHEAHCQIIHYSSLPRGRADAYLISLEGQLAGYGGVWNSNDPNRLVEFYTLPAVRRFALPMFRELLRVSGATHLEAQTNLPLMLTMLYDCAENITDEAILFEDAATTPLVCAEGQFRRITPEERDAIFPHYSEPVGDWGIEWKGEIVATGGFFCHYNPPFGDIFMEVSEPARGRGFGSYLVQELKRVCYAAGKKPAARCNPDNHASRRTLQKAGFLPCGRLLTGETRHPI